MDVDERKERGRGRRTPEEEHRHNLIQAYELKFRRFVFTLSLFFRFDPPPFLLPLDRTGGRVSKEWKGSNGGHIYVIYIRWFRLFRGLINFSVATARHGIKMKRVDEVN